MHPESNGMSPGYDEVVHIHCYVILGYSYTKRFTYLCHFILGLGLSLAPIGAYLAGGGHFDAIPLLYSFAVLCWVAGFDIIYALQDEEFDKSMDLNSIPVRLGRKGALRLSRLLHLLSASGIGIAAALLTRAYPQFEWIHLAAAGGSSPRANCGRRQRPKPRTSAP